MAALAALLAAWGCSSDDGRACDPEVPGDTSCFCRDGVASCSLACPPDAEGCQVYCNGPLQHCSVSGGNQCGITCQDSVDCTATCGDDALIACQGTSGTCVAEVGERADVRCDRANDCQVTCNGSCEVGCASGRCRVSCSAPTDCVVHCDKGFDAPLCPDGITRVCGMEC